MEPLAVQQCTAMLQRYVEDLWQLQAHLRSGLVPGELGILLDAVCGQLECAQCRENERMLQPRVLAVAEEVRAHLGEPSHPCHGALAAALAARLSPPLPEPVTLPVNRLRFTHCSCRDTFAHGDHAGHTIDLVVEQLCSGWLSPTDPSMLLNVVAFHGQHWALNNRHAMALVQYANDAERMRVSAPVVCKVRVWPLVPGLLLDDGSRQDVVRKFVSARSTATEGLSIEARPPSRGTSLRGSRNRCRNTTEVKERCHVHISNIDIAVCEDELKVHVVRSAGGCLGVTIARRKDGRSQGWGKAMFDSPEAARRAVGNGLPPLRGRELRVRLDALAKASAATSAEPSGGWLVCRRCRSRCASLVDVVLVSDVRLPADGTSAAAFEAKRGYFGIADERKALRCVFEPHPESGTMSFKLAMVRCAGCLNDLGNVQDGTRMEGEWSRFCGARVMHFKCQMVALELTDCDVSHVEMTKWSSLGKALGRKGMYRLSELTMRELLRLLQTQDIGRDIRLVDLWQSAAAASS